MQYPASRIRAEMFSFVLLPQRSMNMHEKISFFTDVWWRIATFEKHTYMFFIYKHKHIYIYIYIHISAVNRLKKKNCGRVESGVLDEGDSAGVPQ